MINAAAAAFNSIPFIKGNIGMYKNDTTITSDIKTTVAELLRMENMDDKNALFNVLIEKYSPVRLVSELAKLPDLNQYDFAKQIKNTEAIRFADREIKTIATYFPYIGWGGSERVMLTLHKIWTEMGYRVIVLTDKNAKKDAYPLDKTIERLEIDDGVYDYERRASSIAELINGSKIDLLVYHDWNPVNMIWDELLVKLCGVAFIRHCHTVFSLEFYHPLRKMQDYVAPYLLADAVVTLSNPNKEFWKFFNDNVFSVKNPFVKKNDDWKQSSCEGHEIVWVARIAPEKNPDDLIPIMRAVLEKIPDAKLHVVGSNTFIEYRDSFTKAVRESGLRDKIILHGFQKEVAPFYKDASIFLMTSRFEGDPLTLQEALLSGLPIVMYELPYITLTRDNPGIISCKQGDVNAAAKAIVYLLNNDDARKEIGRKGRLFFEQYLNYDFKRVWTSIFDSLRRKKSNSCTLDQTIMMETLIKHYDIGFEESKEAGIYVGRKTVRYAIKLLKIKDNVNRKVMKKLVKLKN